MSLSREDITLMIAIANFVLTWGVALYMYLANKNKATNDRIGQLEKDIESRFDNHSRAEEEELDTISTELKEHGERLQHLETVSESAPNHGDIGKVYEAIKALAKETNDSMSQLSGTVNQLVGENKGQSDTLRLIVNQLAQKGFSS